MIFMYLVARDTVRWVLRPPRHTNDDERSDMQGSRLLKAGGGKSSADVDIDPNPVLGILMLGYVVAIVVAAHFSGITAAITMVAYWPAAWMIRRNYF